MPASFYILFTVPCSFPLTIMTMISKVAAALLSIKVPGGIKAAIIQTSTDRIVGDNMTSFGEGVNWYTFRGYHYSLKRSEMKVKSVSQN